MDVDSRRTTGNYNRGKRGNDIMATIAQAESDRTVSIGRVFSRGFGTIGSNPLVTIGASFLFGALPSVASLFALQAVQEESLLLLGTSGMVAAGLVSILFGLVIFAIAQGALVRATVAHSEGRVASFGETIQAGLTVVIPLILAAILSSLGIVVGMLFLLVPGIMLYCAWLVVAPAVVEEKLGPIAALKRSRDLTRGARWNVFGVVLILVVAQWILSAILGYIAAATMAVDVTSPNILNAMPSSYLALQAVVQTAIAALYGVIVASLYVELRNWKDGPATETLADVFS
jgi:uncharacterized membrane protein